MLRDYEAAVLVYSVKTENKRGKERKVTATIFPAILPPNAAADILYNINRRIATSNRILDK